MIPFSKDSTYMLLLGVLVFLTTCRGNLDDDWELLFNGRDLDNWGLYLSIPDSSLEVPNWPKDSLGRYEEPLRDQDLLNVYSIDTLQGNQYFAYLEL